MGEDEAPRGRPRVDESILRAAYDAHGGELYRFALRCVVDPDAAEKVVRTVFVRAARTPERLRGDGAEGKEERRAWLLGTARDVMLDVRPMTAEETVARVRRALDIEAGLRRLPEGDRRALLAVSHEGLTYPEVADGDGVSVATVRSRVTVALRGLAAGEDER